MKTKIYKVLSIMLTLAVILSTCLCAIGTVSAATPDGTVAPTMAQGTIDGNAGEIKTSATNRIHTSDLLDFADYTKVTMSTDYKAYYHFYGDGEGANDDWIGSSGAWKFDAEFTIAQIKAMCPEAKYFRIAIGPVVDGNLSPSTFPTDALLLTLVPQTPEGAIEYFVSATGDDAAAGTEAAPMLTVKAAVDAAIAAGYDADDTVYVKTIGADAVNTGLSGKAAFADYSFKLVITAADATVPGTVAGDFEPSGTTEVTYVSLTGIVHFSGENVTIGEGAVISGNAGTYAGQYSNVTNAVNTTKPTTIKISDLRHMTLGLIGSYYNSATYNYPLTVEVENWSLNYNNEVNGGVLISNANCKGTYNSLVNLKFNTCNTRLVFKANESKLFMGENFAFQLINSTGKAVAQTGDTLTRLDSVTGVHTNGLDLIPAGKKYILTNNSGLKDILTFTDTAGKFAVTDPRYVVTATPATGDPIDSEDGFLTVPAGEYTITATKPAEIITYYVASEADGGASANDGKSADKPLLTVAEAIAKANEYGALPTDTLAIKVVGTAGNATWGDDVECNAGVIKVESNDLENLSTIVPPAGAKAIADGALVEYDNIKIQGVVSSGNPDRLISNGRSVTFGANATVLKGYSALFPGFQLTSYNHDITYTVKNAFAGELYLTHWNNNGITYKGDLTYIVDNAAAVANFKVESSYNTASANKINGNLNLVIYDAASFAFQNKGTKGNPYYTITGAAQIITPGKVNADITNIATIGQNDAAPAGGVYHIINATNVPHVVELTDTVGTYKINADLVTRDLVLYDKDGNYSAIEGDTITVTAGTYKVGYAPAEVTYYVDGSEGGDGTEPFPFATVAEAIAAANEAGYTETDTVTVMVLADVLAGTYPAYNFDLIIEGADVLVPADPDVEGSEDTYRPARVEFTDSKNLANNEGKTTTYKHVTIYKANASGSYPDLGANSANLVLEDVEYSAGYLTIEYGNFNDSSSSKSIAGQTVVINGKAPTYVNLSNAGWSGRTYTDLVKLVLNGKTAFPVLQFNAGQGGATKYASNVYIDIQQAAGINGLDGLDGATFEGDVVIVNSAGFDFTAVDNFDQLPAEQLFLINNVSGKADIIEPTFEYDGEFKINFESEVEKVVVKDAEGNPVEVEDGYIYIEAGQYTVDVECIEHVYDYDCDKDCNRCNEVRDVDHSFTEYVNNNDATCQKNATETAACDYGCGTEDTREIADSMVDHKYTSYTSNNDATCQKNCTETASCDFGCGEENTRDIPDSHADHKYTTYTPNNDATCQKLGTETASCDFGCGEENTRDIPDSYADHKYTTYTPNGDATCQKNETETASCDFGCGEQDTRDIPNSMVDHKYTDATDTTCDFECGFTRVLGKQLVEEGGEQYYYNNGVKQVEVTDLVWIDGVWYYIEEGRWASDIDTLHKINGKWFLVKGGIWNKTTGLEEYKGKTFYVSGGKWDASVTDLKKVDGVWYYIEEGRWASDIDTLHKINGKWFLVKGGIWNKTTGLEEYKGKTFYVSGGKWNSSVTDLKKVDGVWYYIQYGKWNNTIDTLHKINGKWFLIKKGIWNKTTGLVEYKGKTFYVSGGKWNSSVNTLYKKGSKYYAIKSGKLYEGKTIITYSGKKFYCNKGYAQLSFSGKVKIGSKTYTIKAGKVV